MRKVVWITVIILFAFGSMGIASDKTSQGTPAPLKPIPQKITAPFKTQGAQSTPQPTPQATMKITVVGADIRNNGYTIEIRNDSASACGTLNVNTFKGANDKPYASPAGGVSVPSLAAGASTQITIDQPQGWNTGYTVLVVEVRTQVGGQNAVVGQRAFGIPAL